MATIIKYQLLPNEGPEVLEVPAGPDRTSTHIQRALHVLAICAIFLLIVCYSWPASITVVISQSSIVSNLKSITNDEVPTASAKYRIIATTTVATKPATTTAKTTTAISTAKTVSTTASTFQTTQLPESSTETTSFTLDPHILENYFVYSAQCQMPSVNPFSKDALKIYHKVPYKSCDSNKDMISVIYEPKLRQYKLQILETNVTCCYKSIMRKGSGAHADGEYKMLPCRSFTHGFQVPQNVTAVITECRRQIDQKLVNRDAFSFVHPINQVSNSSIERKPSVLLWGIDSLSRMNFQRTMPKMHKYLRDSNWYELQGYNKMADNTFPNLLAILTGYNSSRSVSVCHPKVVGGMDNCPMAWKSYKQQGYVTAYAEDWAKFATFNYNKKGFVKIPTDHYIRPFILAIEKELKKQLNSGVPYCVGRRHYAEYIYDSAVQFTQVYKNEPSFGMFWTNSFSHNNFALPSSMDGRMLDYMKTLNQSGIFEKSIIIFFSDHGMRFGRLRHLDSGFLEERMPILYIWLPDWFKQKYPAFAQSLQRNRNRLTSPYDIYATLKHILELQTPHKQLPVPEGCSSCHSVFFDVPRSRCCKDAGIDDHWCTCNSFMKDTGNDTLIKRITNQLIDATNEYLMSKNLTKFCQTLKLSKIESVQKKINLNTQGTESYLIRYETMPKKAIFEASIFWDNKTKKISIDVPDISRLNAYSEDSACVMDNVAKKYCICYK